jgi:hypothetical protein
MSCCVGGIGRYARAIHMKVLICLRHFSSTKPDTSPHRSLQIAPVQFFSFLSNMLALVLQLF